MVARVCSRSCAGSAAWSARSTSKAAPARGVGGPARPRGASPSTRLTEEPDHTPDNADQAHVGGHDGLVCRVLGDQLDVAVAALEALDRGLAFDHGHDDRAVAGLMLRSDEH